MATTSGLSMYSKVLSGAYFSRRPRRPAEALRRSDLGRPRGPVTPNPGRFRRPTGSDRPLRCSGVAICTTVLVQWPPFETVARASRASGAVSMIRSRAAPRAGGKRPGVVPPSHMINRACTMLGCIDLYRRTRPHPPKCNRRLGRPRERSVQVGGLAGGHAGRRRADQAGSTAGPTRLSGPAAQPPPPAPPGSYITVDS